VSLRVGVNCQIALTCKFVLRTELPYVWVFSGMSSFSGFRIVSGKFFFLILRTCPDFWPLSIVTLSFSVVVPYVIIRSSRRQSFNFRTYFRNHFRLFRTHARIGRFRVFILICVQCSRQRFVRCLVRVSLLSLSYNGEREM
jgi:hypothetical protein